MKHHDDQVTMFAQKIFIGKEIQQTSKYFIECKKHLRKVMKHQNAMSVGNAKKNDV